MSKSAIVSPRLAPPVGPFSQAVLSHGFIYVSGQVGQDPATGKLVEGGVAAEAEQVFRNIGAILEAAGKSFDDVVQVRVFLTNIGEYAVINAIYAEQFSAPYPARTAVAVAALPLGASFEIDLVAAA